MAGFQVRVEGANSGDFWSLVLKHECGSGEPVSSHDRNLTPLGVFRNRAEYGQKSTGHFRVMESRKDNHLSYLPAAQRLFGGAFEERCRWRDAESALNSN